MYKEAPLFPARILIVKTSSLGDVVQSLVVLSDLKKRFPNAKIDWVIEARFSSIIEAHPLIHRVIALDIKGKRGLLKGLHALRQEKYDLIFDLQGNCKSGVITFLSRGKVKVGYGRKTVREWPNILATHVRMDISKKQNIRLHYLELIETYFQKASAGEIEGVQFKIEEREEAKISHILSSASRGKVKIMVCPGSKWINKQMSLDTLTTFLKQIETSYEASFLLIWGDEEGKEMCAQLEAELKQSLVVEKLSLPTWQNLMNQVDLVIAVDSSALHLCSTSHTPSFSIFGPTSADIFKPIGKQHIAYQGKCPYNQRFEKQCPLLRSCPTGACIKDLKSEELFRVFESQCGFLRR